MPVTCTVRHSKAWYSFKFWRICDIVVLHLFHANVFLLLRQFQKTSCITCWSLPQAIWSRTVLILSELTNNKELSKFTHALDIKLPSYVWCHKKFCFIKHQKDIHWAPFYWNLPPHKKAISLPIERKQLFSKNREGPDCLDFLCWEHRVWLLC